MKAIVSSLLCVCALVVSTLAADTGGIVYSTHLTGVFLQAIAVDRHGNVYVTGGVSGSGIFVAKLNPAGRTVYSRTIGGFNNEGSGIAVDWEGNAYLTGTTFGNLPTTPNAFQPNFGGNIDGFVIKLDKRGKVVYATYLGGFSTDWGTAIAVDFSGNAYVTGLATVDFPTTPNALSTGGCEEFCAFVTKLNRSGSSLIYSTYLGIGDVTANAIAVDLFGHAYVTGSSFFGVQTTPDAFEPNWPGSAFGEAFVTKLDETGSALAYGTYLAANGLLFQSSGTGIAVDLEGDAFVTGFATDQFPTTPNSVQPTFGGGGQNGFVTKLNSRGESLAYSTYIGSGSMANDVGVDLLGNADVVWGTPGGTDAQVARLNARGSSLVNIGIGSAQDPTNVKIAVDYFGNIYVATLDGFVTKIAAR